MKKTFRVSIDVNGKIRDFDLTRQDGVQPDTDYILAEYSQHYHIAFRKALPPEAKIVQIVEV